MRFDRTSLDLAKALTSSSPKARLRLRTMAQLDSASRQAIVRQVEHYFSVGNLATDQFLRAHMAASSSGYSVPLSVIVSFPRMQQLCPEGACMPGSEGGEGAHQSREEVLAAVLRDSLDVVVTGSPLQVRRRDGSLPLLEQSGAKRSKKSEIVVNHGADHRSPDKSVYVGNLAPEVTDVLLYELFSQVGPVERVTIPLSDEMGAGACHRGFAFVQFADGPVNAAGHSVDYAIRVLHDVALFQRRIVVRRSLSTLNQARSCDDEALLRSRILPGQII